MEEEGAEEARAAAAEPADAAGRVNLGLAQRRRCRPSVHNRSELRACHNVALLLALAS